VVLNGLVIAFHQNIPAKGTQFVSKSQASTNRISLAFLKIIVMFKLQSL
jgi:hypothetical protein